jgi:hypothetical protein
MGCSDAYVKHTIGAYGSLRNRDRLRPDSSNGSRLLIITSDLCHTTLLKKSIWRWEAKHFREADYVAEGTQGRLSTPILLNSLRSPPVFVYLSGTLFAILHSNSVPAHG